MSNLIAFLWYDKLDGQWKTAVTANEVEFERLLNSNPNIGCRSRASVQEIVCEHFNLTTLNSSTATRPPKYAPLTYPIKKGTKVAYNTHEQGTVLEDCASANDMLAVDFRPNCPPEQDRADLTDHSDLRIVL